MLRFDNLSGIMRMAAPLVLFTILFCAPAKADQYQDFIIEKLRQGYSAYMLQARGDNAKKAKLTSIYKAALKKVESKPGLGGITDAHKANDEMAAVVR